MNRYSVIRDKNPREIVLLKGRPCRWGRCSFCDYILDNGVDDSESNAHNEAVLKNVTGCTGRLEVINSGSVFELPEKSLALIKEIVRHKNINTLYFECHYSYRKRLFEIEDYFGIPVVFKCGIETFDNYFRNEVLQKGVTFESPEEVAVFFKSICLMVGIKGQTREMIQRDMAILLDHFEHGCINIYNNNTTKIKADDALIRWFREAYAHLADLPHIEVLWNNTDFGVGGN